MTKKLILFAAVVAFVGVLAAACAQSPVIVYIVVTATPDGVIGTQPVPTTAPTLEQTAPTVTEVTPDSTLQVSAQPTVTIRQIYVAEQPFQRGRMFWVEPTGQIWVMAESEPGLGWWEVYEDLFQEGDVEFDPTMVAPEGLLQPIRGFGLIWRSDSNVRAALGWATDIELGYVANYEFVPGEVSGAGFHFLQNQYGEWFRFNEVNRTWQTVEREAATPTPAGATQ